MSLEDKLYKLLKIYKELPEPIKNTLGVLYRLIPNNIKYGKFYSIYLNRINAGNFSNQEHLNKLLLYCNEKIPYYKNKGYLNIIDFPIINKTLVRKNFEKFIHPKKKNLLKANTGGSSGTPFEFYLEKGVSRPKEKAHFHWYWKQFGYTPKDKVLMIRGEALTNNKLYEYQAVENRLAISCYILNDSNINEVVEVINRYNPKFIHAYPSALKNFISIVNDNSETLKTNIQAIFLGSEGLTESDRTKIKAYFNTKIAHWYGHSERLIHAGNCPYSDDFHIFDFYGFVELVDEENKVINSPGLKGRIVATGYDNSVMPLVRYDTGDEAEYAVNKRCKCGFIGRSFKKIYGRIQDYIYLKDKTKVSLTAFVFGQHFEEFAQIKELQIEQHVYGNITMRIVVQNEEEFNTDKFINKLKSSVNNKLEISLLLVENIKKTQRGKHNFLIQEIKE